MTPRRPADIVAYWLIPAEPARDFFASTIERLATRFEAPLFEPHLTVYAARQRAENPAGVLRDILAGCKPFRVSLGDIQYSDEFTKTVFVRCEPSAELLRLYRALEQASSSRGNYELNPHLSLIYKTMPRETKEEIASSLTLPFQDILFDSGKAVICPVKIESREDVESWRIVATQTLTE
jgi:hypothetical protein